MFINFSNSLLGALYSSMVYSNHEQYIFIIYDSDGSERTKQWGKLFFVFLIEPQNVLGTLGGVGKMRLNIIVLFHYTHFFISNTFVSNAWLKMAKIQANAKQHPQAEILLFEYYSHSWSTLPSKNNRTYSKK